MKASEVMTALRICNNHPSVADKGCPECPYQEHCVLGPGSDAALGLIAADTIEALMKELAEERVKNATGGWISTEERLPDLNMPSLVYNKYYGPMVGWRVDGERFRIPGARFPDHPTHWMPLPAAPELTKEGG